MAKLLISFLCLSLLTVYPLRVQGQSQSLSLTSGGEPSVVGINTLSTSSGVGTQLNAVLNFGEVSPLNGNQQVRLVLPLRISAMTNYKVVMQHSGFPGGSGVQAIDVGFGVDNVRAQTPANDLSGNALLVSPLGNFGHNPGAAPIVNGRPQFQATLGQVAGESTIFTGYATTNNSEAFNSDSGSILVDLTFVIVPQFYTVTGAFSTSITISIQPN